MATMVDETDDTRKRAAERSAEAPNERPTTPGDNDPGPERSDDADDDVKRAEQELAGKLGGFGSGRSA
jgi:hypothetical protein